MRTMAHAVVLSMVMGLLVAGTTGGAWGQQLHPVPFDQALSICVGHYGIWIDYNTQDLEEAEIEDPVAAFEPWEQVSDDPDVWGPHAINLPEPPPGWLFFEPAEDESMELHVIVEDTEHRLGQVVISDRDTGLQVGVLNADPNGSEIDATLVVAPTIEAFNLSVKDRTSATLALVGTQHPKVTDAVVVPHTYGWPANRGDEHQGCPTERSEPWGNPRERPAGVQSTEDIFEWTACCGRVEFFNDSQAPSEKRATYLLNDKQIIGDVPDLPSGLAPDAASKIAAAIANAQTHFAGTDDAHTPYAVLPFSQGAVHFPANVQGEVIGIIYQPYRKRTPIGIDFSGQIAARMGENWRAGVGATDPANEWAGGVGFTITEKTKWRLVGPCVSAGNVWGLIARNGTSVPEGISGIASPTTFVLTTDIPGGPTTGTGRVTLGAAWTTPPPPGVMGQTDRLLEFDQNGECRLDLAKGWKWTAKGKPNMYYTEDSVDLNAPAAGPVTLLCRLQVLMTLKVKTTDPANNPAEAEVEVYRQSGGDWILHSNGNTALVEGEQVWIGSIPLSPGTYKIRARARFGPNPQWAESPLFEVTPAIELIKSIQVDPGQMGGEPGGGGGEAGGGESPPEPPPGEPPPGDPPPGEPPPEP